MKFLSILLCAMSATAFAQQQNNSSPYSKMVSHLSPQLQQILAKQMEAPHGLNKTTTDKQRLVGYSINDFRNGYKDSTYLAYSGYRGSSFANCQENWRGWDGTYSKPDQVLEIRNGILISDTRNTYDNNDSLAGFSLSGYLHNHWDYTRDNAGNIIVTDFYDTVGTQVNHSSEYFTYDNQNRITLDSSFQGSKTNYGYGQNVDSLIGYTWNNGSSSWIAQTKKINIYSGAGLLTLHYQFSTAPGSNVLDSYSRTNYTYNSNGFVILENTQLYDATSGTWGNDQNEALGYNGNNPLLTYVELDHSYKFIGTLNSAGNYDTIYNFQWNNSSGGWDQNNKVRFIYNSFDYITAADLYEIDTATGAISTTVTGRQNYYYQTYNVPDAVTTVNAVFTEITTYPNPVSGKLHVDGNIGSKNVSMQIISITGARLFNTSGNWQSMNKDIDMSSFANGVYYLLITDNNGNKIAAKQIVKN
ncbi:T9SS type A sorting domain-containing protein [Taibaiella soli]|uniref:Secretion system C-terminal sorting domain-containing protein n=1 Tax=Taibaiella soli TaxID=1649169 RepID=A0A2W2B3E2_9BACT|nr:T9SS type A sorting domain-containing protein [Taibaiella soli]PZF74518.1 hypothetical protein DN068_02785 [Taibaiella soli]